MLRKWMPHVAILLSNMYLVFFLIDRVNRAMAFINNGITKGLLVILALASIFNACLLIHDRRERIRAAARRSDAQRRQTAPRAGMAPSAPSGQPRPQPSRSPYQNPAPGRYGTSFPMKRK